MDGTFAPTTNAGYGIGHLAASRRAGQTARPIKMHTCSSGSISGIQTIYTIQVQGQLDASWAEWFEGMAIVHQVDRDGRPVTLLTGIVVDQAALRGILSRIWNLNLAVISVHRDHPAVPRAESICR
jgi:hypothetical protein